MHKLDHLVLLIIVCCFWSCAQDKKDVRPNILFIMTDDHAAHAISAYGGLYQDIAPTPNIDRLAKEGMIFQNVFCTNAICGPSRAAILTGRFSNLNGYYKNHQGGKFDSIQWTFPQEFQRNGYQTALFGKWHLGTEPVGFDQFKYHNNKGQQGTYYDPIYNENGVNTRREGYATVLTTDFALDWLGQTTDTKEPFMMLLQYKAPHREWQPEEKYLKLFEGVEMPFPSTFNDNYEGRQKTAGDTDMTMDNFDPRDMKISPPDSITDAKELRKWSEMGFKRGTGEGWLPHDSMSVQEAREWKYQRYIKDYLACVRSVDDQIGRVLNYLDETGLSENTIVVYTSDQGFYLGDHGWFDKRFMYEQSLKMPFLMRYPNVIKAGEVNKDLIMNIDFAPTLMDFAGIPIGREIQGESFRNNTIQNAESESRASIYYHYYEYPFWHHVQPHYGIRSDRYKLIHFYYDVDVWEFYDLKEDPNELNNLIEQAEYAELIQEMKDRLKDMQRAYKDDISLDSMRVITKTNFGMISGGDH